MKSVPAKTASARFASVSLAVPRSVREISCLRSCSRITLVKLSDAFRRFAPVEICVVEGGARQLGSLKFSILKICVGEGGPRQVCVTQVRPGHIHTIEIRHREVNTRYVDARQVCKRHVHQPFGIPTAPLIPNAGTPLQHRHLRFDSHTSSRPDGQARRRGRVASAGNRTVRVTTLAVRP